VTEEEKKARDHANPEQGDRIGKIDDLFSLLRNRQSVK